MNYADFLAEKEPRPVLAGKEPPALHQSLFPFQRAVAAWAIRRGTAGLFADTGLGKTRMQLEWLRVMAGSRGLIVAPLGVANQTMREAGKLGIDLSYIQSATKSPGLYITNYERLDRFSPADFEAVVLDESSILKSVDGKTRSRLIADWTAVPYRLCCTATPAPNDIEELANHAEFLGVCRRAEMLATYFVHDERVWRLKGHGREPFFRWLATWAMYLRKPSDLGFGDEGYVLPELNVREERVSVEWQPTDGHLFPALAGGVQGRLVARKGSLSERVERAAQLARATPDQVLVWCGLNDEGRELARRLGDECVSIEGADDPDEKVAREQLWRAGEARVLITKPSIFGFGMNWQHCHRMIFLGLGDSWEQYYQAIRRCWRFGQKRPVEVSIIVSDAEHRIVENVMRKEDEARMVAEETIAAVAAHERAELSGETRHENGAAPREASGDGWRLILGDCVDAVAGLPEASVGLSVFSPPFAALYTYSDSSRDMGNCRDYREFFRHFDFLIPELLRVTVPGRRACVHVQQVAMTKTTHGVIGWFDFRADVVRHFVAAGWVYDGEVVIDKDPQAQAIRTKSKALMFVQKNKDSSWSRPAMADYILLFRAPGENPEPVKTDATNEDWILWARPIWYGIRESETLQAAAARDERDEKHVAPLQLETVERCIRLWSNPGDLVLDPFTGIGTTGFVALRHGRRFVGTELKESYFAQAVRNLESATVQQAIPLGMGALHSEESPKA